MCWGRALVTSSEAITSGTMSDMCEAFILCVTWVAFVRCATLHTLCITPPVWCMACICPARSSLASMLWYTENPNEPLVGS
jgi:hypothetical protein